MRKKATAPEKIAISKTQKIRVVTGCTAKIIENKVPVLSCLVLSVPTLKCVDEMNRFLKVDCPEAGGLEYDQKRVLLGSEARNMIKEALILAAGRGSRLDRPGTPKPLVDVDGQPMVMRLLEQLERAGVERIAVVVGYGGDKVRHAIQSRLGLHAKIEVIDNPTWETGIAGSVLAARELFSGPFLIAMSDHVFDGTLVNLMASQKLSSGTVSALVDRTVDNVFSVNTAVKVRLEDDRIVEIDRNLDKYNAVDAGLFAATPDIFAALDLFDKPLRIIASLRK